MKYYMEGDRRKSDYEEKSETTLKADEVIAIGPEGVETAGTVKAPKPLAGRIAILEALVEELEEPLDRRPGEARNAVLGRFRQMLRGGWLYCHFKFCEKFGRNITLGEFQQKANFEIVSNAVKNTHCDNSVKRRPSVSRELICTLRTVHFTKPGFIGRSNRNTSYEYARRWNVT